MAASAIYQILCVNLSMSQPQRVEGLPFIAVLLLLRSPYSNLRVALL